MSDAKHTPTPFLIDGLTIYALNERGTNRIEFRIHGGMVDGERTSHQEAHETAHFIFRAVNAYEKLVEACEAAMACEKDMQLRNLCAPTSLYRDAVNLSAEALSLARGEMK